MEKTVAELANYLSKSNTIYIISFDNLENSSSHFTINNNITTIRWHKKYHSREKRKNDLLSIEPDCCIFFYTSCTILQHVSLIYETNIPIILHEGSNPERIINLNWAQKKLISITNAKNERDILHSRANAIRLVTKEYIKSIHPDFIQQAVYFPNAFFPIDKQTLEKKLAHTNKRIIFIGGLKQNKNLISLLSALIPIKNYFLEWELAIFSTEAQQLNSDYAKKLYKFIENNLPNTKIKFYPPTLTLNKEYLTSDFHIITSLSEGLPNCICEAMCHGIPSIGFNSCPGTNTLIKNNHNGFLVNDVNELTEKILILINNNEIRIQMGKTAWNDSKNFSPNKIYNQWEKLIINSITQKYPYNNTLHQKYFSKQKKLFNSTS